MKDGRTPLYIAAQNGHEQIVEILLEKGNPNVDLADHQVILLIVSFSFSFFSFFHSLIFRFLIFSYYEIVDLVSFFFTSTFFYFLI